MLKYRTYQNTSLQGLLLCSLPSQHRDLHRSKFAFEHLGKFSLVISLVEIQGDQRTGRCIAGFTFRSKAERQIPRFCFAIRTVVIIRLVITQTLCRTTVWTCVGLTAEVRGVGVWRGVCLCEYLGVYTGYQLKLKASE